MADLAEKCMSALCVGASAVTVQVLGIDPRLLGVAFFGSGAGVTCTKSMSAKRTGFVFVLNAVCGAIVGPWLVDVGLYYGLNFMKGDGALRTTVLLTAAVFHVALSAILNQVDPLAKAAARKVGAK